MQGPENRQNVAHAGLLPTTGDKGWTESKGAQPLWPLLAKSLSTCWSPLALLESSRWTCFFPLFGCHYSKKKKRPRGSKWNLDVWLLTTAMGAAVMLRLRAEKRKNYNRGRGHRSDGLGGKMWLWNVHWEKRGCWVRMCVCACMHKCKKQKEAYCLLKT